MLPNAVHSRVIPSPRGVYNNCSLLIKYIVDAFYVIFSSIKHLFFKLEVGPCPIHRLADYLQFGVMNAHVNLLLATYPAVF